VVGLPPATCSLDTLSSLFLFPYLWPSRSALYAQASILHLFQLTGTNKYPSSSQIVALEIPFSLSPLSSIPVLSTLRHPGQHHSPSLLLCRLVSLLCYIPWGSCLVAWKTAYWMAELVRLHWVDENKLHCLMKGVSSKIDIYELESERKAAYGTELISFFSFVCIEGKAKGDIYSSLLPLGMIS